MSYEEDKNPLTGKGRRHVIASMSSVMGLKKSIIIEPEPEPPEPEPIREKPSIIQIPPMRWVQILNEENYIKWKNVLDRIYIKDDNTRGKITLYISAFKINNVIFPEYNWKVLYYWNWERDAANIYNSYIFENTYDGGKERVERAIEEIKNSARIDDYKQIKAVDDKEGIAELLKENIATFGITSSEFKKINHLRLY